MRSTSQRASPFRRDPSSSCDKGYTDFALFAGWNGEGVYFITRQKENADYEVVEERPVPKNRDILKDQIIVLTG